MIEKLDRVGILNGKGRKEGSEEERSVEDIFGGALAEGRMEGESLEFLEIKEEKLKIYI